MILIVSVKDGVISGRDIISSVVTVVKKKNSF